MNRPLSQNKPDWEIIGSSHLPCWAKSTFSSCKWNPILNEFTSLHRNVFLACCLQWLIACALGWNTGNRPCPNLSCYRVGSVWGRVCVMSCSSESLCIDFLGLVTGRGTAKSLCASAWTMCIFFPRQIQNTHTGLDLSVPEYQEVRGKMMSGHVEYHIVVVTRLAAFKSAKHKPEDVVQFMVNI